MPLKAYRKLVWAALMWFLIVTLGTLHCVPATPGITDAAVTDREAPQPCRPGQQKACQVAGIGECGKGIQLCDEKSLLWGECIAKGAATVEQCHDGLDNDCDGQIDEGCCAPTQLAFNHTNLANQLTIPDTSIHPDLSEIAYLKSNYTPEFNYSGVVYRDTKSNQETGSIPHGKTTSSDQLAYSPDGSLLVVLNTPRLATDFELLLIRRKDGSIVHRLETTFKEEATLSTISYADNGHIIAAGFKNKPSFPNVPRDWAPLVLWDARTGKHLRTIDTGHGWVTALAISPDGQRVATGGKGNRVYIWNTNDGTLANTLLGETLEKDPRLENVYQIKFHPTDPNLIAVLPSLYPYCTIYIWDLTTSTIRHTISWPQEHRTKFGTCIHPLRFAFSPNGQWLATAVGKRYLWETRTFKRSVELPSFVPPSVFDDPDHHQFDRSFIQWSADSRQILFAVKYNMTRLKCP